MNAEQIQALLSDYFTDSRVSVEGADGRFELLVISDAFVGLSRIRRQQAVYAAIGDHIRTGAIHAVSIRAVTQDEWNAQAARG